MRLSCCAGVLALMLAVASSPASADQQIDLQLDEVRVQQAELREAALAGHGSFEHMGASKRMEVASRQGELLAMLEGKQSMDQLSPEQQTEVLNTLGWIEAAITQAEDSRIVCRRERVLGSQLKTRICKSVAQRRAEREAARGRMSSPTRMKDVEGL